jgi:hypothetical protein
MRRVGRLALVAFVFLPVAGARAQATTSPSDAASERAAIDALVSRLMSASEPVDPLTRMLDEAETHGYLIERIGAFVRQHPDDPAAPRLTVSRLRSIELLASLLGQDLSRLSVEVSRLGAQSSRTGEPSADWQAVRQAADWSQMRLRLAELRNARRAGLPEPSSAAPPVTADLEVIQAFVTRYPSASASVPLLERLIEGRFRAGDLSARPWLDLLQANHSEHVTTRAIQGRVRMFSSIGVKWQPALAAADGTPFDWSCVSGRMTIVVFWSSRHLPCVERLRRLAELQEGLGPDGPAIVPVAIDTDAERVRKVLGEIGPAWPVLCERLGWHSPLTLEYGIRSLPLTLILDRDGCLRAVHDAGAAFDAIAAGMQGVGPGAASRPTSRPDQEK